MTYMDKKGKLLDKINSGNFNFSSEDKYFITNNLDLYIEFINKLQSDSNLWNSIDDCDLLFPVNLDNFLETIDSLWNHDTWINYVIMEFKNRGTILERLSMVDDVPLLNNLNNDLVDDLVGEVITLLKDPNFKFKSKYVKFYPGLLNYLISTGRFDLCKNIDIFNNDYLLDYEQFEEILTNFDFSNYSFPYISKYVDNLFNTNGDYRELFKENYSSYPLSIRLSIALREEDDYSRNYYFKDLIPEVFNSIVSGKVIDYYSEQFIDNDFYQLLLNYATKNGVADSSELNSLLIKSGNINLLSERYIDDDCIKQINEQIRIDNPNYLYQLYGGLYSSSIILDNKYLYDTLIEKEHYEFLNYNYRFGDYVEKLFSKYSMTDNINSFLSNPTKYLETYNSIINGLKSREDNYQLLRNVILSYETMFEDSNFTSRLLDVIKNDYSFAKSLLNDKCSLFSIDGLRDILKFYFSEDSVFSRELIKYIDRNENDLDINTIDNYNIIRDYYVKVYGLNSEHIDYLKDNFGLSIIKFLNNSNIRSIINLDDEKFNKIVDLFLGDKSIDRTYIENIYDSIKMYEYKLSNPKVFSIFDDIKKSILSDDSNYLFYVEKLLSVMDSKFYQEFYSNYPDIRGEKYQGMRLFTLLSDFIKGDFIEEKNYSLEVLHYICDYYIGRKQEEFRKTFNNDTSMQKDLRFSFNKNYDSFDSKRAIRTFINRDTLNFKSLLFEELLGNGLEPSLCDDLINKYIGNDSCKFNNSSDVINQNMKLFGRISNEFLDRFLGRYCSYVDLEEFFSADKSSLDFVDTDYQVLYYQMLASLDLDKIDFLVNDSNSDVYNSLKDTIYKYKLINIPSGVIKYLEDRDIYWNPNLDLVSLINNYPYIYKKMDSNKHLSNDDMLNFMSCLKVASFYSSKSDFYTNILGREDCRILQMNLGPYAPVRSVDYTLDKAVSYTLNAFLRDSVTIPTFNEITEIDDDKSLRVVVGNFTNSSNVTHGERTGSCMRIKGAADSLLRFCMENENGFHIRFQDSETGEYVSRVSGFRNGNTVFLNQLRCSVSDSYSDSDVRKAMMDVASKIIDYSKNSSYPIDNVLCTKTYALECSKLAEVYFGIGDSGRGLPGFSKDIINVGVVLASSNNGSLVPINFNKDNIPRYLPARDLPICNMECNDFSNKVLRVDTINRKLNGLNTDIDDSMFDDIEYGYVGDDWYLYSDSKGVIHENLITNMGNIIDKRALIEREAAREIVSSRISNSSNYSK